MTGFWIAPSNIALLRIDVQRTFCPGGKLPVPEGDEIVPVLNRIGRHFSLIVDTQDWHPKGHSSFASTHPGREPFDVIDMPNGKQVLWPYHAEQDSADAAFHPGLMPSHYRIRKGTNPLIDSYSAFRENDHKTAPRMDSGETLARLLRRKRVDTLVMGGLAFDYCVGYSALDAADEGFRVVLVKDATRAIAPTSEDEMTKRLLQAGIVICSEDRLHNAIGVAGAPTAIASPARGPL